MTENHREYWVECTDCGNVYSPVIKSPAWWKAKQKGGGAYVGSKECGCRREKTVVRPEAPYRVFGYDLLSEEFDIPFDRMIDAMKAFIRINRGPDIVFISGIRSKEVQDYLHYHAK